MERMKVRPVRTENKRQRTPRWSTVLLAGLFVLPVFAFANPNPAAKSSAPSVTSKSVALATTPSKFIATAMAPSKASAHAKLFAPGDGFFEIGDGNIGVDNGADDWLNVLGFTGPPANSHLI